MPDYGPRGKKNFPAGRMPDPDETTKHLLKASYVGYSQPRVHSDEELAQRFDDYYRFCAEQNIIPTVEALYQWTGWSYEYCHDMLIGRRKGFSPETAQIFKKARDFIREFDAQMVVQGKLNPIVYFFRAKNYYGMTDQQQITVAPQTTIAMEGMTAEELSKRLLAATPSDDENS